MNDIDVEEYMLPHVTVQLVLHCGREFIEIFPIPVVDRINMFISKFNNTLKYFGEASTYASRQDTLNSLYSVYKDARIYIDVIRIINNGSRGSINDPNYTFALNVIDENFRKMYCAFEVAVSRLS